MKWVEIALNRQHMCLFAAMTLFQNNSNSKKGGGKEEKNNVLFLLHVKVRALHLFESILLVTLCKRKAREGREPLCVRQHQKRKNERERERNCAPLHY